MTPKQKNNIRKRGCGGVWLSTPNGMEFECDHEYVWTCDNCPCNLKAHNELRDNPLAGLSERNCHEYGDTETD